MPLDYITQYQTVIMAGLAILIAVIFYRLVKKRPKKEATSLDIQPAIHDEYEEENNEKGKHLCQDIYDEDMQSKTPHKAQKKEIINAPVEKELQKSIKTKQTKEEPKLFTKQIVPAHGKIKKEDFEKFNGKRILLAEDNIINQKVLLGLLGSSGLDISIANDGQEVLEILEKDDDFMLILMDAHMPNIDGFEATKIIRKNPQYNHIPVIALSGDTASDDIKKMLDAGMSDTLEKPLKMDALYDILYAYNVTRTKKIDTTPVKKDKSQILDTTSGLSICGEDKHLYIDVLKEFIDDYSDSYNKLSSFNKENKYTDADKLLLDIVGICANLGLQKLNTVAVQIKEKLKTDTRILDSQLNLYQRTLQQTLDAIKEYFKK